MIGGGDPGDAIVHAGAVVCIGVGPDPQAEVEAAAGGFARDKPQGLEIAVSLVVGKSERGDVVSRNFHQKRIRKVKIDVADFLRVVVLNAESKAECVEAVAGEHRQIRAPEVTVVQPAAVFDLVGDEAGHRADAIGRVLDQRIAELQTRGSVGCRPDSIRQFRGGVDQPGGVASRHEQRGASVDHARAKQHHLRPVRNGDTGGERGGRARAGSAQHDHGAARRFGSRLGALHSEAAGRQCSLEMIGRPAPGCAIADLIGQVDHHRHDFPLRQCGQRQRGQRADGRGAQEIPLEFHFPALPIVLHHLPRAVRHASYSGRAASASG